LKLFVLYDPKDLERFQIPSFVEWIEKRLPLEEIFVYQRENQSVITADSYLTMNMANFDVILIFCSENLIQNQIAKFQIDNIYSLDKKMIPIFDNWDHIPPILRQVQNVEYTPKAQENFRNIIYNLLSSHPSITLPAIDLSLLPENERQTFLQNVSAIKQQTVNEKGQKVNPKIWVKLGLFLEKIRDDIRTEMSYRTAILLNPQEIIAWKALVNFMQNVKKDYSELEWFYAKYLELNSKDSTMWIGLGDFLRLKKWDMSKAEKCYRKAVEANPASADAWMRLGMAFKSRNAAEAELCFQKAIDVSPNDPALWTALGNAKFEISKKNQEAEACYNKALEIDPTFGWAWVSLGNFLYVVKQDLQETFRCYSKAREFAPQPTAKK
jgi:tetratricopeptide (TPR) repeat protein